MNTLTLDSMAMIRNDIQIDFKGVIMKNPNNAIMMCGLYASTIVIIFFYAKQ